MRLKGGGIVQFVLWLYACARLLLILLFQPDLRFPWFSPSDSGILINTQSVDRILPVIFQDFKNEAEEYQFLTFDNEIARWSELDKQAVYDKIDLLDLDIELLGIQDFKMIDLQDANDEEKQESDRKWMIEVQFPNEMEMRDIYDDLIFKGYIAKVKGE